MRWSAYSAAKVDTSVELGMRVLRPFIDHCGSGMRVRGGREEGGVTMLHARRVSVCRGVECCVMRVGKVPGFCGFKESQQMQGCLSNNPGHSPLALRCSDVAHP